MFGLSVVQAATTLAAVLVGYNLKIFDEMVLNGAIGMIVVTCPLGSWVVERHGRRMASHDEGRPVLPRPEQRLLVPVSNPASARRLLDIAFLLRDTALPGAIYPVTIVQDEGEAAVDIPVNPSVRVGLNVSDGIVRAAKESRVDTVLIGWGGSRTAARHFFGTVLENIMDDCPSRIVLCRVPQPLNTTRRLLLPLPPLADRREDIEAVLHDAKWLARQIGADLHVWLCEPSAAPGLRQRIERAQPSVPLAIQEARDWREARSRLFEDIQANDMAMVLVERRRSTLWSPSQDRFSAILASRFPDNNLLAFYPPLTTYGDFSPPPAVQTPSAPLLVPVEGLSDAANLEEALRRMTGSIPAWTFGQRASVFSLLADSARTYPVEMAPGVVFVHAHSDAVRTTTLLVGRGTRAWILPGGGAPVRIVLALISPRGQSPEIHLKALSALAKKFHGTALAERIHAAASAEEICRMIEGEYA
jgi:mannitol/fructose-specific phosphotransferase system IIA component (Ntr-type)